MRTMRDLLEAAGGGMRVLFERLEVMTKTGVKLRVLPGGEDSSVQDAPQPTAKPRPIGSVGFWIGDTVEKNGLRMHRYASALRVMDLANAGKRGKVVDEFALYNLDYSFDVRVAGVIEDALIKIAEARTYSAALKIAQDAVDEAKALRIGLVPSIEINRLRGVDVEAPAGGTGAKIVIKAPEFELEASPVTFSVRQKAKGYEDTTNHIPPVHGAKKTAIARFYVWVRANEKEIKGWGYHDLSRAMADADLDYHTYSTMD